MVRKLAVVAAWVTFGLICFVTLSPIGLRPQTGDPRLERFIAYALLGALFMAAYPRHFVKLAILLAIATKIARLAIVAWVKLQGTEPVHLF
jgi:hypothetical protein